MAGHGCGLFLLQTGAILFSLPSWRKVAVDIAAINNYNQDMALELSVPEIQKLMRELPAPYARQVAFAHDTLHLRPDGHDAETVWSWRGGSELLGPKGALTWENASTVDDVLLLMFYRMLRAPAMGRFWNPDQRIYVPWSAPVHRVCEQLVREGAPTSWVMFRPRLAVDIESDYDADDDAGGVIGWTLYHQYPTRCPVLNDPAWVTLIYSERIRDRAPDMFQPGL